MDVFPLVACTNSGSLPSRADKSRRDTTSLSYRADKSLSWAEFFKTNAFLVPDYRTFLLFVIFVAVLRLYVLFGASLCSGQF